MIESLLKEIGFKTTTAINYDPHLIISLRKQVNKNNPFEHQEVEGLVENENWSDYPLVMQNEEDIQQGSTSLVQDISITQLDPLVIMSTTKIITPIASHSEMTNKRTFSDDMETKQEHNSVKSKK